MPSRPVHGATDAENCRPLPVSSFDRKRDKLIGLRLRGAITQSEYDHDMRRLNEAERRREERAKPKHRGRA